MQLKAQELQVAVDVANAGLAVENTYKQFQAAQKTREAPSSNAEAEQTRFDVGMSTNYNVVQAQNDLTSARLNELRRDHQLSECRCRVRSRSASWRPITRDRALAESMRKILLGVVVAAALAAAAWYYWSGSQEAAAAPSAGPGATGGAAEPRQAAEAAGGRGGAMTVETGVAGRHEIVDYITVVGNLIGEATVDVVPRVAGRLDSVQVKLGDRVAKGQPVAKVEDREIREQINQSEANIEVNRATVVSRENDAKVAESASSAHRPASSAG